MKLFADTVVNAGRQQALDYAKGFALICMVLCHTVIYYADGHTDGAFVFAEEVLGGPLAAPLFMLCMGVGISYSRHNSPTQLVRRGFELLVGGYALNLARAGIPVGIGYKLFGVTEAADYFYFSVLFVDILQFAGLALMFLGLAKKLLLPNWVLLGFALCASVLGSLVRGYDFGQLGMNAMAGLFLPVGSREGLHFISGFPFLCWIIFPVTGYVMGQYLQRCADVRRLYAWVFCITLPITAVYVWMTCRWGFWPLSQGMYYWVSVFESFFFVALDLLLVSLWFWVEPFMPRVVLNRLQCLSFNMTAVYCISWCLIGWSAIGVQLATDYQGIDSWWGYLFGFVIAGVSCQLAGRWMAHWASKQVQQTTKNTK